MNQGETGTLHIDMDIICPIVRFLLDSIGHYACGTLIDDLAPIGIIGIDNCDPLRFQMREQLQLRRKITFQRAVKIQMIVRQIGKDRHIEIDGFHPSQL